MKKITPAQVRALLARGEPVQFVDARNPHAWADADRKLEHAVRIPADAVDEHVRELPRGRPIVAYCT